MDQLRSRRFVRPRDQLAERAIQTDENLVAFVKQQSLDQHAVWPIPKPLFNLIHKGSETRALFAQRFIYQRLQLSRIKLLVFEPRQALRRAQQSLSQRRINFDAGAVGQRRGHRSSNVLSHDRAMLHLAVYRRADFGVWKLSLQKVLSVKDVVSGAVVNARGPVSITIHKQLRTVHERTPGRIFRLLQKRLDVETRSLLQTPAEIIFVSVIDERKRQCAAGR